MITNGPNDEATKARQPYDVPSDVTNGQPHDVRILTKVQFSPEGAVKHTSQAHIQLKPCRPTIVSLSGCTNYVSLVNINL